MGVTIIGDSVTVGARSALSNSIDNSVINANGGRFMWEGCEIFHFAARPRGTC